LLFQMRNLYRYVEGWKPQKERSARTLQDMNQAKLVALPSDLYPSSDESSEGSLEAGDDDDEEEEAGEEGAEDNNLSEEDEDDDDDESMSDAEEEEEEEEGELSTVLGAHFPAPLRIREGRCEYSPLFWALEAVFGEGHEEAQAAVEAIVAKRGGNVEVVQGLNHHSWVEGSLLAMAVAAAVEAAAPVPDLPEDPAADWQRRARGEGSSTSALDAAAGAAGSGSAAGAAASALRCILEAVTDADADADAAAADADVAATDADATTAAAALGGGSAGGGSAAGAASIPGGAASTDGGAAGSVATESAAAESAAAGSVAAGPVAGSAAGELGVEKLPAGGPSRFRGASRGLLGASRFNKKKTPTPSQVSVVGGIKSESNASVVKAPLEAAAAVAAGAAAGAGGGAEAASIDGGGEGQEREREREVLTPAEAALHAEVDALGAPSEAGDDVGNVADAAITAATTTNNVGDGEPSIDEPPKDPAEVKAALKVGLYKLVDSSSSTDLKCLVSTLEP
jgi:hypothetical protein